MNNFFGIITIILLSYVTALKAQPQLELYPMIHTIGVNIYLNGAADPEEDAMITLEYKKSVDTNFDEGFPLSKVHQSAQPVGNYTMLSGSIFYCDPGTSYDVSATVTDANSPSMNFTMNGNITTRPEIVFPVASKSYYISPDGNGTQCDSLQPCSIQYAFQQVNAGEEVVMLNGNYYTGKLSLTNTGNASSPIIIRAASNQHPVLNGADTTTYNWVPYGSNGIYSTLINYFNWSMWNYSFPLNTVAAENTNMIAVDGVRLYPYRNLGDLDALTISCELAYPLPCGVSGFYRDRNACISTGTFPNISWIPNNRLYIKLADGSDPNLHNIKISVQKHAINLTGKSYIFFRRIKFENYGLEPYAGAIRMSDANEIVFDHCDFRHNDIGISVADSSKRMTVQHCNFYDNTDWDTYIGKSTYDNSVLCGVYTDYSRMLEKGGIVYGHGSSARGMIVRGCLFSGFMDGFKGVVPSGSYDKSREFDIYGNAISGGDDGVEIDGIAANVRIWGNIFHDAGALISLAPAEMGPVYIFKNVFFDFRTTRATITGFDSLVTFQGRPLKFDVAAGYGGDVFFFHNTISPEGNGEGWGMNVRVPMLFKKFVSKNNIITSEQNLAVHLVDQSGSTIPPVDFDYNCYFTPNAFASTRIGATTYNFSSLTDWTTAYQLDSHSIFANPLFLDAYGRDFTPAPGSPAIDAGLVIKGINDKNYYGTAPDIGAFETNYTSTQVAELKGDFLVYPNPTSGLLNIKMKTSGKYEVRIYDSLGKIVLKDEFTGHSFLLDIADFRKGIYLVSILGVDKKIILLQ